MVDPAPTPPGSLVPNPRSSGAPVCLFVGASVSVVPLCACLRLPVSLYGVCAIP